MPVEWLPRGLAGRRRSGSFGPSPRRARRALRPSRRLTSLLLAIAGLVLLLRSLAGGPFALAAGNASSAGTQTPLFIRLVEATRGALGPRPVALMEDAWYSLEDVVQRNLYWLTHAQPSAIGQGGSAASPVSSPAATPPSAAADKRSAARVVSSPGAPASSGTSPAPHPADLAPRPSASGTPAASGISGPPHAIALPARWPRALGEGVWVPAGRQVGGQPTLEQTFVLPDPARPYARVALVWINPALAQVHLMAGTRHPLSRTPEPRIGQVPWAARPRLLAAFNGGFKRMGDHYASFGFRTGGRTYRSPTPGLATLAVYASHSVRLGALGTEIPSSPAPADLLQNLPLIVDHGAISPHINEGAYWGQTVGNAVRVWRSGLGQTSSGALIYAAGVPLTARRLAAVLRSAGARRAMELDINSYWVTFNFYQPVAPGSYSLRTSKLLPSMVRPATRYLSPDTRPFVYLTTPG